MAIENIVICDICNIAKKETNNWFRVRMTDKNPFCLLTPGARPQKGDLDICGQRDLHSLLDRYLESLHLQVTTTKRNAVLEAETLPSPEGDAYGV